VVGAGSVVTKQVAPLSIVAGSPAREIGKRNSDLNYEIDYHRLFA
jgi:acetyltransferase-like isoleucine patch superfamily enzyme